MYLPPSALISIGTLLPVNVEHKLLWYLIKLIWRIKKYDWSRAVTWREDKTSFSLQTSCLPVVSHGTALRWPGLWRHSTCFACQVSLIENERQKYAKLRFNVCSPDKKFSLSFRYNKQLIAQIVGRHEDLFNPENQCLPRASPSGDMNFVLTNLHVSLQTGQ